MSYKSCGVRVFTNDLINRQATLYSGIDGVDYVVANRADVWINDPLTFDASHVPYAESEWVDGLGSVQTIGVILDSNGNEVLRFYPPNLIRAASEAQRKAVTQPKNPPAFPVGQYQIVTFDPYTSNPRTAGEGIICIAGLSTTPTPTPTFTPTLTPTPTPATPTPTPTATPLPTITPTPIPLNPVPLAQTPIGEQFTLTYSEAVKGWPSFYSYHPDYMTGMNNYFYSFSGGNLFRHNTNVLRNNYYNRQYNSSITTVLNESPLENKLFKTVSLESDSSWSVTLNTDIENEAFMSATWFEKKEGAYYAAVKNVAQVPAQLNSFAFRSVNGIGNTTGFTMTNPRVFSFSVPIDSIISIGDYLYYNDQYSNSPALAGVITAMSATSITVDSTINGATNPTTNTPLMLAFKNTISESHGILGHYSIIKLENRGPLSTELFAVESEVMKSYP